MSVAATRRSTGPGPRAMGLRPHLAMVGALMRRALNEVLRVPGAAVPGVMAPTIFVFGLSSVFGELVRLPGFTADSFLSFVLPVGLLQGAAFTGAATGVNLARDIEQGWFDRLLVSPAPRAVLLVGIVLSASLRALLPVGFLVLAGVVLGAGVSGLGGLVLALALAAGFAAVAASWGTVLALRFRTQSAAPLMQAGVFMAVLFTTAYAPLELLTGWLQAVARLNPVTLVLEAVRQPFTGEPTWSGTWPGLVALVGLGAVFALLAERGLRRSGR